MTPTTQNKADLVRDRLKNLGPVLVALSGGVDSGLLIRLAALVQGTPPVAVTFRSVLNPPGDLVQADQTVRALGIRHIVEDVDPLAHPAVAGNQPDRCYHCKTMLAQRMTALARDLGCAAVVEGSQADDAHAHRPGARALAEAGITSPLAEAGFTKNDVREALKSLGDPRWNRPSSACLATRFPYHSALSPANLAQVRQAEAILADLGFPGVRARHHGDILRIEPPLDQLDRLAAADVRDRLVSAFRALGFRHITLDLAGYTSGVFDPAPAGMPVAAA